MISRGVTVSPAARRDLDHLTLWLRQEGGSEIAGRFAKSAIRTFGKLADTPGLGSPVPTASPELARTRKWRIASFPAHLVFYRPSEKGIEILRVLHAAADWWALLDID